MRLKVTRRQENLLSPLFAHLCDLYNAALAERTGAWQSARKSISYYDQQKQLTELREEEREFATFPAAIQRDPLIRVGRAFTGFFWRVRHGEKPGYPRFRAKARYNSFSVDSQNFRVEGDTVVIVKLGGFRFRTRCRLRGVPKTLHVIRRGQKWTARVVCDIGPAPEKLPVGNAVGIDLGLTTLATLSDGTQIENPRWTQQKAERLAEANRSLSRKRRGSRNRIKARDRLRRVHQRIAGLRSSYLDCVARWLVEKFDLIAHEKLNIRGMAQSRLSKSIMDAAWRQLIWKLTYKAEEAGKWVIPVKPHGTTQICSGCAEKVPKELWDREHVCPHCGLVLDRDHNAALNILRLGESLVEVRQNV